MGFVGRLICLRLGDRDVQIQDVSAHLVLLDNATGEDPEIHRVLALLLNDRVLFKSFFGVEALLAHRVFHDPDRFYSFKLFLQVLLPTKATIFAKFEQFGSLLRRGRTDEGFTLLFGVY